MNGFQSVFDTDAVRLEAGVILNNINKLDDFWVHVGQCSQDYMCTRDIIKNVVDELECKSNESYIGILEWAFVQEAIDSQNAGKMVINIDNVLRRFFSHRDVKVMFEGG